MSFEIMPLEFANVQSTSAQNLQEANGSQEETNLFDDYKAWQDESDINQKAYYDLIQKAYDSGKLNQNTLDIIDSIYYEEQEKIGLEFDFMQGADVDDKEAYDTQTFKLAQGKVETQDKDNDDKISLMEFLDGELGGDIAEVKYLIKNGELSKEDAQDFLTEASLLGINLFNIIDVAMGNSDGSIDAAEYQTYYQYLDGWTGTPGESYQDGKIFATDEQEYNEYLATQVKNTDEQRETMGKYIERKLA